MADIEIIEAQGVSFVKITLHDEMVRAEPEQAYEAEFAERMRNRQVLDGLMAD